MNEFHTGGLSVTIWRWDTVFHRTLAKLFKGYITDELYEALINELKQLKKMNAISELKRLPENKAQQETFVNAVIGEILSGEHDPILVDYQLKVLEDTITKIRKDVRVKSILLEEVEQYGKEGCKRGDMTMRLKTRSTFDFSNDNEHVRLKAELKAREALLKALGHIPDTGEALIKKHSEFIEIKY